MKEEIFVEKEIYERLKKIGLADKTLGEIADEFERLIAEKAPGSKVPCSVGLSDEALVTAKALKEIWMGTHQIGYPRDTLRISEIHEIADTATREIEVMLIKRQGT